MCIVKKYGLDLRRNFVSNHCVASMKPGLVDLCFFSGEGKPTLLGGFVLSPKQAFDLGHALVNTSRVSDSLTEEDKNKAIHDNIVMAYTMLKELNPEQAQKLKELFDIKIIKDPEITEHNDTGYIG